MNTNHLRTPVTVICCAALTTSVACRDDTAQPVGPLPLVPQRALQGAGDVPSGEILFAELSGRVPSAAGFYFDAPNSITVSVVAPTDGPRAVATVRDFLSRGAIPVMANQAIAVRWRQARYSYSELSRIRDLVFDRAFDARRGVVILDLDEVGNRVVLGATAAAQAETRQTVRELLLSDGRDTAAVTVMERQPIRTTGFWPRIGYFTWTHLTFPSDEIVAGLEVGDTGWGCTIGFVADYSAVTGFMTASHCTRDVGGDMWGYDGYGANQHAYGDLAGYEYADPGAWGCGVWQVCRRSDAAFYQSVAGRNYKRGLITRPSNTSNSLTPDGSQPYFIITGEANGYYGQTVYKIGKVSGWRTGTIYETCVDFPEEFGLGYVRVVRCANNASTFNDFGDSGGPVFLPVGGPYVYLSGTTNGRPGGTTNTSYSTMSQIQLDFGNALVVTRPSNLTTPSVSGTLPTGAPTISWSAISGASAYHVYKQIDGVGPFTYESEVTNPAYTDGTATVVSVHGSPPSPPFVAYYVRAQGGSDISANSNTVYFRKKAILVTIQGNSSVLPNELCYWTAIATGGTGSYSYDWKVNGGGSFPNSSQFSYSSSSSYSLSVMVTDGTSVPGSQLVNISVGPGNPDCQL